MHIVCALSLSYRAGLLFVIFSSILLWLHILILIVLHLPEIFFLSRSICRKFVFVFRHHQWLEFNSFTVVWKEDFYRAAVHKFLEIGWRKSRCLENLENKGGPWRSGHRVLWDADMSSLSSVTMKYCFCFNSQVQKKKTLLCNIFRL